MSYYNSVFINDGPNLDAFSRLRVSTPTTLHDGQMTYGLPTTVYDIVTSSNATASWDSTNRCALLSLNAAPSGSTAYMQSFDFARYQPGKSQVALLTFNFSGSVQDCIRFAGYSDGINGIELQSSGSSVGFALLNTTGYGNQFVSQSAWNLDTMDGKGPSGRNLDFTKIQILYIDLQSLYVGRVRVGFDVDGTLTYAHQFVHANYIQFPYIAYASLPVRCGMRCGNTVTAQMRFICSSIMTEGTYDAALGYGFSATGSVTALATKTALFNIRPKATFNGVINRAQIILDGFSLTSLSSSSLAWELAVGYSGSAGTYSDVLTGSSVMEYTSNFTASGQPVGIVSTGAIPSSGSVYIPIPINKYPITLGATGLQRTGANVTLSATSLTGAKGIAFGSLVWREVK